MLQHQIDSLNRMRNIQVSGDGIEVAKYVVDRIQNNRAIEGKVLGTMRKQQMHQLYACASKYMDARQAHQEQGAKKPNDAMRLAFEKAKRKAEVV